MQLQPNLHWTPNQNIVLPTVHANVELYPEFFTVHFSVQEPPSCFFAQMNKDGGHAWEESCVEVFVESLDDSGDYCNFEFTSKGFCYAARGQDRSHRKEITAEEYATIQRKVTLPHIDKSLISWDLKVLIRAKLIGVEKDLTKKTLHGNLYKCADKSETPHYLSLFPINTEKPDFHRPEFFQKLISSTGTILYSPL